MKGRHMGLRERILNAVVQEFDEKGVRFTMDELANRIGVSKRTIYEQVGNKEHIIDILISDAFLSIKAQEKEILENDSLSLLEKLKTILGIMPNIVGGINYQKIFELEKFYPDLYIKIEDNLERGWNVTLSLLNEAINQGIIRPVNPVLFKEILLITMDNMLKSTFLFENNITYNETVQFIIDVIFNGLLTGKV